MRVMGYSMGMNITYYATNVKTYHYRFTFKPITNTTSILDFLRKYS